METPHLDHHVRLGRDVAALFSAASVPVLLISGKDADAIGSMTMQEFANVRGVPVLVNGDTEYHDDCRLFMPRA